MTDFPSRDFPGSARRRLLEATQQGDHAAQHGLVRRYEPLVQRVVWRLGLPPGYEREDLAQEARIGLRLAIRAWRAERGPFPAFADRCVSNQALLAAKAASTNKHRVLNLATSLDALHGSHTSDDRSARALVDALAAPRDPRSDPEARLIAREDLTSGLRALATLTQNGRAGLAIALNGESYSRRTLTFTGTPKAASQAAYRARRKLAEALDRGDHPGAHDIRLGMATGRGRLLSEELRCPGYGVAALTSCSRTDR